MKKEDAIGHLNKLNTIIAGSNNIIQAIESEKTINIEKSIKAAMLNSIKLAEELKFILTLLVEDPGSANYKEWLSDLFKK